MLFLMSSGFRIVYEFNSRYMLISIGKVSQLRGKPKSAGTVSVPVTALFSRRFLTVVRQWKPDVMELRDKQRILVY
jgi:hypothetical protein